jgi:hypothetical protein
MPLLRHSVNSSGLAIVTGGSLAVPSVAVNVPLAQHEPHRDVALVGGMSEMGPKAVKLRLSKCCPLYSQ